MSLLNEFQLQAIRDFRNSVAELHEDLNDSAFDIQDIEQLMDDLLNAWETVKAQLADDEEEEEDDSLDPSEGYV